MSSTTAARPAAHSGMSPKIAPIGRPQRRSWVIAVTIASWPGPGCVRLSICRSRGNGGRSRRAPSSGPIRPVALAAVSSHSSSPTGWRSCSAGDGRGRRADRARSRLGSRPSSSTVGVADGQSASSASGAGRLAVRAGRSAGRTSRDPARRGIPHWRQRPIMPAKSSGPDGSRIASSVRGRCRSKRDLPGLRRGPCRPGTDDASARRSRPRASDRDASAVASGPGPPVGRDAER